jgi:hypothetical protein
MMLLQKGVSKTVVAIAIAIAIIVVGIVVYIALTTQAPKAPYKLVIFTGGTGGVYYPIGVKLSELLNKYAGDRITASVSTSGASVANVRALAAGDANLIFVQNDIAYYAHKGIYMFNGSPVITIRGLVILYPEIIQIVVRADSGIKTLYDLAGKRVAVGASGSGTVVEAEIILKAAGLWNKITPQYLDFRQAAEALRLGQIDAAFVVAGIPTAAIMELSATVPINLVEVPDEVYQALQQQGYRFFTRFVVPKGTYTGLDRDVKTLAVMAMLATRADVPDDVVYTILKTMYDHIDELQQAHARAKDIKLETALEGMPIPLHPGAIKFFEERGIRVPPELRP